MALTEQDNIKFIWILRIFFPIIVFLLHLTKNQLLSDTVEYSFIYVSQVLFIFATSHFWTMISHEIGHVITGNYFIKNSMYIKNILRTEFKTCNGFKTYQIRIIAIAGIFMHIVISFIASLILMQLFRIPLRYNFLSIIVTIVFSYESLKPEIKENGPTDMYYFLYPDKGLEILKKKLNPEKSYNSK